MAIQFRRSSTAPTYTTLNALSDGQPFFDMTNNRLYVGGYTTYSSSSTLCSVARGGALWSVMWRLGDSTLQCINGQRVAGVVEFYSTDVPETGAAATIANYMYNYGGYRYSSGIWAMANGRYSTAASSTYSTCYPLMAVAPNSSSQLYLIYSNFGTVFDDIDYYGAFYTAVPIGLAGDVIRAIKYSL